MTHESSWFGSSIFFNADGYDTSGPKLMGRQAAGQGFLRAYVAAAQARNLQASAWLTAQTPAAEQEARRAFQQAGLTHSLELLGPASMHRLTQSGCLYVPQPGLSDLAWKRLRVGERSFSLCGVTHTTASHAVMDTLSELPMAPMRPWDAVVCTSHAVHHTVQELVAQRMDYLRWKLGASHVELPQLPVIPLGVHVRDYDFSEADRAQARAQLGVGPQEKVVLFVGRLSFHAKAHPHPMLLALQQVAERSGLQLHLVQAGWFASEAIEQAFKQACAQLAPNVKHHFLDARNARQRQIAWAGADVFCSLSDNIQETFGLTPIEAMAAGLPVVVSDWDGYKDTVRHGVDGFRIRTFMPRAGEGVDFAARYELGLDSYDMYCGKVCEFVAVDLAQTQAAFMDLLSHDALRLRMGAAARERAHQVFDWAVVMSQYEALWRELKSLRKASDGVSVSLGSNPLSCSPARPDPLALFSSYPTVVLHQTTQVTRCVVVDPENYARTVEMGVHRYARTVLPNWEQVQCIVRSLQAGPMSVAELLEQAALTDVGVRRRHLVWMAKVGWLAFSSEH